MKLNLLGQRFGRLLVIASALSRRNLSGNLDKYWLCRCDCGVEKEIVGNSLRRKKSPTRSCGCYAKANMSKVKKTHGHTTTRAGTPTYRSWTSMKGRCTNPNYTGYNHYGGAGIEVCNRWLDSFEAFLEDMKERPLGTTLDRKDNSKGYEPDNCRWATAKEQTVNRAITKELEYQGRAYTLPDLAKHVGVGDDALRHRIVEKKMSVEKAISEAQRWYKIKGEKVYNA